MTSEIEILLSGSKLIIPFAKSLNSSDKVALRLFSMTFQYFELSVRYPLYSLFVSSMAGPLLNGWKPRTSYISIIPAEKISDLAPS
jgi:hypothetical protein